jgi:hypothetical protein
MTRTFMPAPFLGSCLAIFVLAAVDAPTTLHVLRDVANRVSNAPPLHSAADAAGLPEFAQKVRTYAKICGRFGLTQSATTLRPTGRQKHGAQARSDGVGYRLY